MRLTLPARLTYRPDDVVDITVGQLRRQWERDGPLTDPVRRWEIPGPVSEAFPVVRVDVDRPVVHPRANAHGVQTSHELVPRTPGLLRIHEQRVEVPRVHAVR